MFPPPIRPVSYSRTIKYFTQLKVILFTRKIIAEVNFLLYNWELASTDTKIKNIGDVVGKNYWRSNCVT